MPSVAVETASTSDLVIPDPESTQFVRVLGYALSSDGAGTLQFFSDTVALSGPMPVAETGGFVTSGFSHGIGVFDTTRGNGLTIATTGGITVAGHIAYSVYP